MPSATSCITRGSFTDVTLWKFPICCLQPGSYAIQLRTSRIQRVLDDFVHVRVTCVSGVKWALLHILFWSRVLPTRVTVVTTYRVC